MIGTCNSCTFDQESRQYRGMTTRTIAIVEDEGPIRDNYREALERYGFQTLGLADRSGAEAAFC